MLKNSVLVPFQGAHSGAAKTTTARPRIAWQSTAGCLVVWCCGTPPIVLTETSTARAGKSDGAHGLVPRLTTVQQLEALQHLSCQIQAGAASSCTGSHGE